MSYVHVCLVSDQPVPNLIPLRMEELKARKVILLVSVDMTTQAERLEKVISEWNIATEKRLIEPFNLEAAMDTCLETLADIDKEEAILNVTGGTKIMALAAYEVFRREKAIIYVDTRDRQIIQLSPHKMRFDFQDIIKIKPYLAAYGQIMQKEYAPDEKEMKNRYPLLETLIRDISRFERPIGILNRYSSQARAREARFFPYRVAVEEFDLNSADFRELLELFELSSVLKLSGTRIEFPTYANACFASGDWLCEYVYHVVSSFSPKDLKIGVEVGWDQKGRQPPTNEYDVVFTLNNQLFLIECKTKRFEGEDRKSTSSDPIYKLGSLKDSAGGLYGKGMLVSYKKLTDDQKERLKANKLKYCDSGDLKNLKEKMKAWTK